MKRWQAPAWVAATAVGGRYSRGWQLQPWVAGTGVGGGRSALRQYSSPLPRPDDTRLTEALHITEDGAPQERNACWCVIPWVIG